MRIIVAPQEFKGTLTAVQAARAMAEGARRAAPQADVAEVPVADGGPGTVQAIVAAAGGETRTATVQDPLGREIEAEWGLLPDAAAVIEMAAAASLVLLSASERDPRRTSTYGVGQLIQAALDADCRRLIVGAGGSATNDGGAGMAQALGAGLLDARGHDLPPGGAALTHLSRIDVSRLDPRLSHCQAVVATDVVNPLCGPDGASLVYGPQKGASLTVARELDAALHLYAQVVQRDVGVAVLDVPGAGAAGGLGAGLIAFLRARVRPGIEVVAEAIGLEERIRGADLVLTGEGRLDGQTRFGKAVAGVARIARGLGVPVLVVPGTLAEGWEHILPLVAGVEPVVGGKVTAEEALAHPAQLLAITAERAVAGWAGSQEIRR